MPSGSHSPSTPVSRRGTKNEKQSSRSGSNLDRNARGSKDGQSRTKSGSKDLGSKRGTEENRKGTNASSRTGRSGRSTNDDDSTDSEVDLNEVPMALRNAVPLHLKESRILKKNEKFREGSTSPLGQPARRRVGEFKKEEEILDDPDPPPIVEVYVDKYKIRIGVALFMLWAMTIIPLLLVHVFTFYNTLADKMHHSYANQVVFRLQADFATEMSPAVDTITMIGLQAGAGLFDEPNENKSNMTESQRKDAVYVAVTRALASNIKTSQRMLFVKVVNVAEKMLMVRPGNLHYVPMDENGDGYIDVLISPENMKANAHVIECLFPSQGYDPFTCFNLGPEQIGAKRMHHGEHNIAITFHGPEFLEEGKDGLLLEDVRKRPLAIRMLANANFTAKDAKPVASSVFGEEAKIPVTTLALDVGLDLAGVGEVATAQTPEGGLIFLFTADGSVVAGTNWTADYYVGEGGQVVYQNIWEFPYPWAKQVTKEKVASLEPFEFFTETKDLVAVHPAGLKSDVLLIEALRHEFRILVYLPRSTAVRDHFVHSINAGIGVAGAPVVFAIVAIIVWLITDLVRWCRLGCPCNCWCFRSCRRQPEEFAWSMEIADD